MANQCFSLIRGRMMRATRTDGCGNPLLGPDAAIATKGFVRVALTPNQTEGETITVTNADGEDCVSDTPAPRFQSYGVQIDFCGVNPLLINMLTGQPVVVNSEGDQVGFRVNSKVDLENLGFALEVWARVPAAMCEPGVGQQFGYQLLPFIQGGTLGEYEIANAAANFTITGAITQDGSGWGVGPYDVILDSGVPSPLLEPIDPNDHLHLEKTSVAPPEDSCDPIALGVEATTATAGTPATLEPANSYAPADFEDLTASSLVASPTTAWTAGQYLVLRDGSRAHWDGTAWAEGVA